MPPTDGLPLPGPDANDFTLPRLVMPARRVRAGAGATWVADGWRLFRKAPVMWIVFLLLFFLVQVGLGLVPFVGALAGSVASPILLGGIMLGCRSLETGGELELEHVLAGFRRNTGLLFAIGVVYALGELALLGVMAVIAGPAVVVSMVSGDAVALTRALNEADLIRVALGALVALALALPLMAAFWFAPALAMLNDVPALPAMKASLAASLRNFLPMLVYGIVMGLLMVLAMVPVFLGLLVWVPLLVATAYTSYRSVFTEADGEAA